MKKFVMLLSIFVAGVIVLGLPVSAAWRGTEGREATRRTVGKAAVKESGKTTEDIRGRSGRTEGRRAVGKAAVKQSGKTTEEIRGVEGRQEFRQEVGKDVYEETKE